MVRTQPERIRIAVRVPSGHGVFQSLEVTVLRITAPEHHREEPIEFPAEQLVLSVFVDIRLNAV